MLIVSVGLSGRTGDHAHGQRRAKLQKHVLAVIRLGIRKRAEAERLLGVAWIECEAFGQSGVVDLGGAFPVGLDQVDCERLLGGGVEPDFDGDVVPLANE